MLTGRKNATTAYILFVLREMRNWWLEECKRIAEMTARRYGDRLIFALFGLEVLQIFAPGLLKESQ